MGLGDMGDLNSGSIGRSCWEGLGDWAHFELKGLGDFRD